MLRVISGDKRGKIIRFPVNKETRPTSNLVKESLFNVLQFDIRGSEFLDLFFGSGQIGIEALSRGAKTVVFVDNNKECERRLRKNLDNMKIGNNFKIFNMAVEDYLLRSEKKFDIIFLDPPYNLGISHQILKKIEKNTKGTAIIVAETQKNEFLDDFYGNFKLQRSYIYGKKKITVFKN